MVGKPESEDVFMDEDEAPKAPEEVKKSNRMVGQKLKTLIWMKESFHQIPKR